MEKDLEQKKSLYRKEDEVKNRPEKKSPLQKKYFERKKKPM